MENRIQRIFLTALLIGVAIPAIAEDDKGKLGRSDQVIVPELERRELKKPNIDSLDFEVGVYYGVLSIQDFGTNPVVGATVAFHATEDFFLEAEYGSSEGDETSFEKLSGGAQLLDSEDRKYTYYDVSLGWNIFPGESFILRKYAFSSSFYIIGGIGGTEFGGDSAFTVNLGVGYRLLLTDWLAIRVDVRDYLFDRDIFGETDRANNLELRTGFSVFF
ncbi:MAG: outer membrane beta-barrel domain-containing protein [Spongiibacteraceae bacterium]